MPSQIGTQVTAAAVSFEPSIAYLLPNRPRKPQPSRLIKPNPGGNGQAPPNSLITRRLQSQQEETQITQVGLRPHEAVELVDRAVRVGGDQITQVGLRLVGSHGEAPFKSVSEETRSSVSWDCDFLGF